MDCKRKGKENLPSNSKRLRFQSTGAAGGVFRCFTVDGDDVNLYRRSAFSSVRKAEVRDIRRKGACLRCRLLKRPVCVVHIWTMSSCEMLIVPSAQDKTLAEHALQQHRGLLDRGLCLGWSASVLLLRLSISLTKVSVINTCNRQCSQRPRKS
jgi:hypothetical protein